MTFGDALAALKAGQQVARSGWNGKGMWLHLVTLEGDHTFTTSEGVEERYEAAPWIGMKTADNKFVPWLASQTDVLADDWNVVT